MYYICLFFCIIITLYIVTKIYKIKNEISILFNFQNVTVPGSNDTMYVEDINANPDFSFYRNIYGACIAAILLTSFIRGLAITFTTIKASTTLHNMFLRKIIGSPLMFFESTPSGRIQNIFSRDIDES